MSVSSGQGGGLGPSLAVTLRQDRGSRGMLTAACGVTGPSSMRASSWM